MSKGVVPVGTFFIVKKAAYGLDQSPRDWGFTRDAELRKPENSLEKQALKLVQSLADECVWFVVDVETVLVQDPDSPVPAQSQEVLQAGLRPDPYSKHFASKRLHCYT